MRVSIKEESVFNQIITAVLDKDRILDLRKGGVSDHARQCAQYHARKYNQSMIHIFYADGKTSHLPSREDK